MSTGSLLPNPSSALRNSLVFQTGLVPRTAWARQSRPQVAGVDQKCHPCSNRFLSQSSWVQRGALALQHAVERVRVSLTLALERCTLLQVLARRSLQELERCIPRQELARRSSPLTVERCTLPQEEARHILLALELRI